MTQNKRAFVTEYPYGTGETGYRAGEDGGYETAEAALREAEKLSAETGFTYGVDWFFVDADGERSHDETIGYV